MEPKATPAPYPFRLLKTGLRDGFYNMALDEALLEAVSRGASLPVLRFYGWTPPTVSLGYFQGIREEVDLDACKRHGVGVVRRISGGGAVFHQAELTYSIIMKETHPLAGNDIQASYATLCAAIVAGLAHLGVASQFVPINDIIAGGRKISGNAQGRRKGCVLQHGTILLENDLDLMFELLRVPSEKIRGKLIADVKERVTSLKALLGRSVSFDEAAAAMTAGFKEALSLELVETPVSAPLPERDRARELAATKFAAPEWLYSR
ncbi:octanoyltransferase LipM [Spirochaetia bacterium]|nr:octanoyltransferase LipM [Spirochaetia bacterium]